MPGGARLVDGDGATIVSYANGPANTLDDGPVINVADFQSVGDLAGDGSPDVVKGGLTLNGAANLFAVNQNLPFSHVEQAWDPATGQALAGYPRATDDFQLLSQASIARVGDGSGRQALVGTGLYNLHAYGPAGLEPDGWPKFTGGWQQATPAVGDADADGDLDVTTLTREGWSFLWSTGVDACTDSNTEWWTFHHDERSTANYGADGRPPGTARGLGATRNADGSVTLAWTAPGDDWLCGAAERFRGTVASGPIDDPGDGREVADAEATAAASGGESLTLGAAEIGDATHAAVQYRDEAGNWGLLRSVALRPANGAEPPLGGGGAGGGGPGGGAGPGAAACANRIVGSAGKDRLNGTPLGDRIRGRGGRDRLRGRRGDDCLNGGRGADRVRAGRGDDRLRGGRGRDKLRCGPGEDVAFVSGRDRGRGCEEIRRR